MPTLLTSCISRVTRKVHYSHSVHRTSRSQALRPTLGQYDEPRSGKPAILLSSEIIEMGEQFARARALDLWRRTFPRLPFEADLFFVEGMLSTPSYQSLINGKVDSVSTLKSCLKSSKLHFASASADRGERSLAKVTDAENSKPRYLVQSFASGESHRDVIAVSYTHLTLPTTPYV